jgi:PAS domain S-box-containing protein
LSIINKIKNIFQFNSDAILSFEDVKDFFVSTLLKFIAVSGMFAALPGLIHENYNNNYTPSIYFFILTILIFWFTFFSKVEYKTKALLMTVFFLLVGTSVIFILGPIYLGPFWLFTSILIVAAIYSFNKTIITIIYSNLIIYIFTIAYPAYHVYWKRPQEILDSEAISLFISFFAVSTAFGLLVNRAFKLLEKIINQYNEQKNKLLEQNKNFQLTANKLEQEIKERSIVENQLVKSEQRLMQALDTSKDGYWEWDIESGEVYFSSRYYTMLGYEANEFQPSFQAFDNLIYPQDKPEFQQVLNNSINTGITFEYTFRLKTKTGNWLWVVTKGQVVEKTTSGKAKRMVGVHSNVNDQKVAELKLKELNETLQSQVQERTKELEYTLETLRQENNSRKAIQQELTKAKDELTKTLSKEKELNELKSRFISMITHEYRTPLTAILTSTYVIDILFQKQDKQEFDKYLNKIQTSVESMNSLLEDVLMLGEYQFSNKHIEKTKIDLIEFIEKTISDQIKYHGKMRKYEINNVNNSLYFNTNIRIFRYIFSNIISNAIKYSDDDKTIYIEISQKETSAIIKVRDEGIGIMEEDLEKLYDPFHRGKNVGAISGTGLGLALVKQYSEILDINVNIKSKVNEGTEVALELLNATN